MIAHGDHLRFAVLESLDGGWALQDGTIGWLGPDLLWQGAVEGGPPLSAAPDAGDPP